MAVEHEDDPLFSFQEAGRWLRPERPIHVSAFHRWRHGIRGQKLETTVIGGRRYVRRSQLESFIAALSGSSDSAAPAPLRATSPGQQRRIDAARRELKAAGIA